MFPRKTFTLKLRGRKLLLGPRTLIMGVLNLTPDSFSDGGKYFSAARAVRAAREMQCAGANILDIGAESTRPGSSAVSVAEELSRLLPVLQALRGKLEIPISVDTRKAAVAQIALGAGAEILNDVSGLRHDPRLAQVAARQRSGLILVHMRGTPESMQKLPFAKNITREVSAGLRQSITLARRAGVNRSQIILDPGIGFGKSFDQNYELLAKLPKLSELGYPLLVGTSRKGFIGQTLASETGQSAPPGARLWGTAATVAASILNGAHMVRVHDVKELAQVSRVADELLRNC
jgi:dihydropteroate synthase